MQRKGQGRGGGDDGRDEKIVVRRSVYEWAQSTEREADAAGWAPFDLAEKKLADCKAAGDVIGAELWRRVWAYLMAVSSSGAGTEVEIVEDGEDG